MKLLFASSNLGKFKEMSEIFHGLSGYSLVGAHELCPDKLGPIPQPIESGASYEENAAIKAKEFNLWAGIPCLSDDTGLEVVGLGGAPGIYSARYAGEPASASANITKLLSELDARGCSEPLCEGRAARFVCVVCVWGLPGAPLFARGELKGRIVPSPEGAGGFGYDSVFEVEGYGKTLALLKAEGSPVPTHRQLAVHSLLAHCLSPS